MNRPFHVLILESSRVAADSFARELRAVFPEVEIARADGKDVFLSQLSLSFDLILAGNPAPPFTALEALRTVGRTNSKVPFIVISETGTEAAAIEALKAGATDYILGSQLGRLGYIARRALEQKQSEEALRRTEELFRAIVQDQTEMIVRWKPDGTRTFVNQAYCRTFGKPYEELVGTSFMPLIAERYRGAVWNKLERITPRTPSCIDEHESILPDGTLCWQEWMDRGLFDQDGVLVELQSVGRDTTERKRAEIALRESESRFRQVTENIEEVFWLMDLSNTSIIYASPAYERIWGRDLPGLLAARHGWLAPVHPDDLELVKRGYEEAARGNGCNLEYRILHPSGTPRWIHDRAFPIKDQAGKVYRLAGIAEDITERKSLEAQLRQSQKMEALGRLAGGIAHDFNNIIGVIMVQGSALLESPDLSGADREGIEEIGTAASRAAGLVRQLLTFSRRQIDHPREMNLGSVVEGLASMLRRVLSEAIVMETRIAPNLPTVSGDPGMMEQILVNLAVNARDAMPHGGTIEISVDAVMVSKQSLPAKDRLKPGVFVRLRVKDSGCGIPAENYSRIFEPFFTTKEIGKGTGLGLATVFGIVEQHHGWIEVESEPGKGAAFTVFLPASSAQSPASPQPARAPAIPRGSETILLVEDESPLRRAVGISLRKLGYSVLEASNGAEALAIFHDNADRIQLLLTDVVMPGGISGMQLAQMLKLERSSLKIIVSSGYNLESTPGLSEEDFHFLAKPYETSELARIVRESLESLA